MLRHASSHRQKGSAAVEFVALAPIIAAMILAILQIAALFTQSVSDVAEAEAAADRAVLDWDAAQAGRGFHRPCLEEMPVPSVAKGGAPLSVGAGVWRQVVGVPQEVVLVQEPVCTR